MTCELCNGTRVHWRTYPGGIMTSEPCPVCKPLTDEERREHMRRLREKCEGVKVPVDD